MIGDTPVVGKYESFLDQFDVRLSPDQHNLLDRYIAELSQWNKAFNLTGLRDIDEIVRHLLLDSLICAAQLPSHGMALDIGSGAGLPAVPIKIYHPSMEVHALEPRRKRANFLKHIKRVLGLRGFHIFSERLQEHRKGPGLLYETITARAVMKPLDLLALCPGLLKKGGTLALFLGKEGKTLADQILKEARAVGLSLNSIVEYKLPGLPNPRCLAFLQRCAQPRSMYN